MPIHLIRHGQTLWNTEGRIQGWSDSDLDATGLQQAEQCRTALADIDFTAVYSSPSGRALQTAEVLCQDRELVIETDPDLREMGLGPWEGRRWEEIDEIDPDAAMLMRKARHRFTLDGAERLHQTQARGLACIQRLTTAHGDNDLLIVSHGVLIKSVLLHYAGKPLEHYNAAPSLANCSHSTLVFDDQAELCTRQWGGQALRDDISAPTT